MGVLGLGVSGFGVWGLGFRVGVDAFWISGCLERSGHFLNGFERY